MVPCQQCGAPNDINRIDTRGGNGEEQGDGGNGSVASTESSYTLLNGTTHTETNGVQSVSRGAGCWCCGSKNSSKDAPRKAQ